MPLLFFADALMLMPPLRCFDYAIFAASCYAADTALLRHACRYYAADGSSPRMPCHCYATPLVFSLMLTPCRCRCRWPPLPPIFTPCCHCRYAAADFDAIVRHCCAACHYRYTAFSLFTAVCFRHFRRYAADFTQCHARHDAACFSLITRFSFRHDAAISPFFAAPRQSC